VDDGGFGNDYEDQVAENPYQLAESGGQGDIIMEV
jgi:hypothetical protein